MTMTKNILVKNMLIRSMIAGKFSAFAMFIALTTIAVPAFALEAFTADYRANYMGMQGIAQMTLSPAGDNQWRYQLNIKSTLATLSQTTVFEDRNGQWRPLTGNDSANVLVKKSNKTATYDWNKGEARWSGDVKPDRAGPVKLQAGDVDGMLLNLAIVRDVNAGKPLNYRLVDNGSAKSFSYEVIGKEAIDVGGKSQQATKLSRTDGDKQTIIWVADGLPVPARILQRKKGRDEIDLQIQGVR